MHRNIPIVVVARCLDIHCYRELSAGLLNSILPLW
jgi:hypothetical protein